MMRQSNSILCQEVWKTLPALSEPGEYQDNPESSSSVPPTSNRMTSLLETPHLLLTEPSLTRGRHIPYLIATGLILSAEKLRNCCFLTPGTLCDCWTSTGNPVTGGLESMAPQPKSTGVRQGSCSWSLPSGAINKAVPLQNSMGAVDQCSNLL